MLCHYKALPVAAPLYSPASSTASLNTLSEDFVARLQANVPSSVSTILRTACKLQVLAVLDELAQRHLCVLMMHGVHINMTALCCVICLLQGLVCCFAPESYSTSRFYSIAFVVC